MSDSNPDTNPDSNPSIQVTYDASTGAISYSPKQISVPAVTTDTVIAVTIETLNEGAGGPATFYGFSIRSGWLPVMSVSMTNSTISILDPNTVDNPVPGTFGFVTLVQAPPDAPGGDSNPDPTIYNEPIGG